MAERRKRAEITPKAPSFTRTELLTAERYRARRDLLGVLLKDGQRYTFPEVDALIEDFMKGRVK